MTRKILQLYLSLCLGCGLVAQGVVNPGDANHDGTVDHHDLLSVGYAFGSVGAPRMGAGPNNSQAITQLWGNEFPNGLNYAFADADGNGQINFLDLLFVNLNDGNTFSGGFDINLPQGIAGIDPEVNMNNGSDLDAQVITGQELILPLQVENLPLENGINGIALTLTLDTSLIESIDFDFSEAWLLADGAAFPFFRQEGNRIRIALTRFGQDPVSLPSGEIGILRITIIEDLVGLLPNTADDPIEIVGITGLQLMDGSFEALATTGRGLSIAALSSVSNTQEIAAGAELVEIVPNPSAGQLRIQSEHQFQRLELIHLTGQKQLLYDGDSRQQHQLNLQDRPPGLYYLRLTDAKGWSATKAIVLK